MTPSSSDVVMSPHSLFHSKLVNEFLHSLNQNVYRPSVYKVRLFWFRLRGSILTNLVDCLSFPVHIGFTSHDPTPLSPLHPPLHSVHWHRYRSYRNIRHFPWNRIQVFLYPSVSSQNSFPYCTRLNKIFPGKIDNITFIWNPLVSSFLPLNNPPIIYSVRTLPPPTLVPPSSSPPPLFSVYDLYETSFLVTLKDYLTYTSHSFSFPHFRWGSKSRVVYLPTSTVVTSTWSDTHLDLRGGG